MIDEVARRKAVKAVAKASEALTLIRVLQRDLVALRALLDTSQAFLDDRE